MSSLTCNAVLGCITQSSRCCQWRGRGQRLTTAKESSRSDREREREKVSKRESERAPGLCLTVPPAAEPPHFSSLLCTCLPTSSRSVSPPTSSIISAFHLSALIALSSSHPLFTLHPSSSFSSFFLSCPME